LCTPLTIFFSKERGRDVTILVGEEEEGLRVHVGDISSASAQQYT
jgi:hypothetical protein